MNSEIKRCSNKDNTICLSPRLYLTKLKLFPLSLVSLRLNTTCLRSPGLFAHAPTLISARWHIRQEQNSHCKKTCSIYFHWGSSEIGESCHVTEGTHATSLCLTSSLNSSRQPGAPCLPCPPSCKARLSLPPSPLATPAFPSATALFPSQYKISASYFPPLLKPTHYPDQHNWPQNRATQRKVARGEQMRKREQKTNAYRSHPIISGTRHQWLCFWRRQK